MRDQVKHVDKDRPGVTFLSFCVLAKGLAITVIGDFSMLDSQGEA